MLRFGVFGKVLAQPGQRDALVQVLLEAAEILGQMPECELYLVNTVPDEPDSIWVTEVWANEEAHAQSLTRDDVRALIQRGRPLIADMPEQVLLTPVGGKGLSGP
jgi:quinol monooxygenase YgiN